MSWNYYVGQDMFSSWSPLRAETFFKTKDTVSSILVLLYFRPHKSPFPTASTKNKALKGEVLKKSRIDKVVPWGEKKKVEKSIRISQQLFIILPNALGSKEAKYPRFFQKIFEYPFPPLRYFFYPFLICGLLKKGQICTSEVKNDDNSKFFENNYPRFFVQGIYGRCGFSTEIYNKNFEPTNGNFDSKSKYFLGKFKFSKSLKSTTFDPRWKKNFFWRTQLPYLLPLTYHKFMTTFYFFFLSYHKKIIFSKNPIFHDQNFFWKKKCYFWKKNFGREK